jgi:hypothetical protein
MKNTSVGILILVWFVIATLAVWAGLLVRIPPPAILLVLATAATLAGLLVPRLREWVATANLRLLLFPHLVRFVGLIFLILVSRGVLPSAFAPVGWGDLAAAVGALLLFAIGTPLNVPSGRWWAWLGWNIFGISDMALLVATAVPLAITAPDQFTLFRQLPFGLLPTFAVPLIIATHVLLLKGLLTSRWRPAA